MKQPLFTGALVHLAAPDPERGAEALARWSLDSEYHRLQDNNPARPLLSKRLREEMAQEEPRDQAFVFAIHTLSDDSLIGFVDIDITQWIHGDAFVGIAIGERDYWDKGYGTDAMRVMLRYAFTELNLHRVSLSVFEYNPRALRSYKKAGFVVEGRLRQWINREGRYWDLIFMGILREEWLA